MKYFSYIIVLLIVCCMPLFAKEPMTVIRGTVSSNDGALPGAVVICLRKGQTEISYSEYAVTDAYGHFALPLFTPPGKSDSIRATMLGYTTCTLPIIINRDIEFRLTEKVIQLREVKVRAPKVRMAGDTVKFNVQSFIEAQDKSISDVLKRMPGIEVRDNGDIYYNNEPIGNLYIEHVDILGGRYNLLTNNLSAKDVKTVEVMENHQPIKVVSEINKHTKSAINLVLKDEVRGKWFGTVDLDAGVTSDPEALWNGNLLYMMVGKKWNSVNNLKTNNTGIDITAELDDKSLYNSLSMQRPEKFIDVGTSDAPLDHHRVKFNKSVLFNTSHLWQLDSTRKITATAAYLFDKQESWNGSATTYFFNDGEQQTIVESDSAMTHRHYLQARLNAEINKKEYYFRNLLSVEGEIANATQIIAGEFPNRQKAKMPYYYIADNLKYVNRIGNHSVTVESQNAFSQSDQKLTVLRSGNAQQQNIGLMDFSTNTFISSEFWINSRFTSGLLGGVEVKVRKLQSRLDGIDSVDVGSCSFQNDLLAAQIHPYITPHFEYKAKSWNFKLTVPIGYSHFWLLNTNKFTYNVTGSVKYSPHPKFYAEIIGSAGNQDLDIRNYYTGYILRNYRYLSVGSTNTRQNSHYSVVGLLKFKDPVNMLFIEGLVGRYWNVFQISSTRDFLGDYIVLGTEYLPSRGDSWQAVINGSIGLYGINGKVGFAVTYTNFTSSSMLQNGECTPFSTDVITFKPTFSGRFAKWIGMEYNLKYSHNIMTLPNSKTTDTKDNFSHTLLLNITPVKRFDIKLMAEHYFTMITAELTKNTVLLDALVAYRLNNGIELRLTAHNLLNQKIYAYSTFTPLQEFSCEYSIRPLNITAGVSFEF